jgi:hypothetical protein
MNKNSIFRVAVISSLIAVGGCAATLQSDDDLLSATAMSMGLQPSDITISNRQDSTTAVNYWVKTRSGRNYSCVRTVGVSVIGTVKSSPLCNPTNAKAEAAPASGPSNALLDAYRQQQKK